MSEEKIQNITSPQPEEQEIDLIELAQKVVANWFLRRVVSLPLLDWLLHLVFLRSILQV